MLKNYNFFKLISGQYFKNWSSKRLLFFILLLGVTIAPYVIAGETGGNEGKVDGHGGQAALIFLWIAIILIFAKISSLVEKFGLQPRQSYSWWVL